MGTKIDDAEFRELWAEGVRVAEIAERYGVWPTAVYRRARDLGLPSRDRLGRPWSESELRLLREEYGRAPARDIATEVGRSVGSVYTKAQHLGLLTRRGGHSTIDEKEFRRLWIAGVHAEEIAARFGVAPQAVYIRARRMGLPSRLEKLPADALRRLWSDGVSLSEIAARFGVTRQAVHVRAKNMGLPSRKPGRRSKIDADELRRLWAGGSTPAEIAARFGVTREAIYSRARRLGLPPRRQAE